MSGARVPAPVTAFFAMDLALAAAYLLDYLAGHPYWKLMLLLDLDSEANIPAWYASMKWFCVAVLLGLLAANNVLRRERACWGLVVLSLVFLAFSVDEVAQIHEWLGRRSDALLPRSNREGTMLSRTGLWTVVVGVPFIVAFILVMRTLRTFFRSAPSAFFKICLGMIVMLGGAVGLETFSNFIVPDSPYIMAEVLFEELFEMLGATIVLWGSYELLQRNGFVLQFATPAAGN